MLELAVLGLLHESPLHGYELRQRLKATLGSFRAFSYGSLYPTLRRMKDAGWIAEDEGDAEVVAGAPALTGRRGELPHGALNARHGVHSRPWPGGFSRRSGWDRRADAEVCERHVLSAFA